MSEATLPLFPELPLGQAQPARELLGSHGEVQYRALPVREVLNRNRGSHTTAHWTLNPYRGCEFACGYCYGRYTHGYLGLDSGHEFDTRIFVKQGARPALARRLERAALRGEAIAIGTVTDPYQPAERHHRVTRSLLETLVCVAGLELSIATRSPLILRDLALLGELDRRHVVTINFTLTTLDRELAGRIEPQSPAPGARLEAIAGLAAEGLAVRLCAMPVLPRITDGTAVMEPLLEAARRAGAFDAVAAPLFLRAGAKRRFLAWLRREFPELLPHYRRLYARRSHLRGRQREEVLAEFRRLRLRLGFPADRPGRS